ncbi:MAG: DEAD/DEAH box helicase [Abditibacteriales bacterium]|nr:DEAD/DEAH box helicase [Abditibacteriales bacterium]
MDTLRASADYRGQIAHVEKLPARAARFADLSRPLHPRLMAALRTQGITRFYVHQAAAIDAVRSGRNVAVVTTTASGKTLTYNVPVLESILTDAGTRALYVFPTKALAQDQLRKLNALDLFPHVRAGTYDGDTTQEERRTMRRAAQIVLTNPDMLHVGILPNHTLWASFLMGLRYVVIDEVHTYRGIFGAHTAHVIRRLRRLCRHYHSEPQFILCSATIANPEEAAHKLTGLPFHIVRDDSAPRGEKTFVLWSPPPIGQGTRGKEPPSTLNLQPSTIVRRSANAEAADLFARLVQQQVRTIVFTPARVTAELILKYARDQLSHPTTRGLADSIMSYRAGYLPEERRAIERQLFDGTLLGVSATNALELGVDIGGLDAVIMVGFPGSISSTYQQAGRAGRGLQPSLAVLVAREGAIDQYIVRHPDYLFGRGSENVVIDPQNIYILAAHLLCAADELPLDERDKEIFGEQITDLCERLRDGGLLTKRDRWYWTGPGRPQDQINLRSASGSGYDIRLTSRGNELLGTVDAARAFDTVHEGAIYLHRGDAYRVTRLDVEGRTAYVEPVQVNYYTQPMTNIATSVGEVERERPLPSGVSLKFGTVNVTTQVIGYREVQQFSEQVLAVHSLDLPPSEFETRGFWLCIAENLALELRAAYDLLGSLHAAEHAMIALLPLVATCDERDVGGVSYAFHPDTRTPTIFVYDDYPGGAGIAEKACENVETLLQRTLEALESCPCADGCPACVQSPRCGSNNQPLDKVGAAALLRRLLVNS